MPKPHVSLPPRPAVPLTAVPPQSVRSSFSAWAWLRPQPNQQRLSLFQDLGPMHSAEVTKAERAIKSSSDDSSAFLKWPWMCPGPSFLPTELSLGLTWTGEHRADPASITKPGAAQANAQALQRIVVPRVTRTDIWAGCLFSRLLGKI